MTKNSKRSDLVKEGLQESRMQRIEAVMRLIVKVTEILHNKRLDHNNIRVGQLPTPVGVTPGTPPLLNAIGELLNALSKDPAFINMQKESYGIRSMHSKLSTNVNLKVQGRMHDGYSVIWRSLEGIWNMAEDMIKDLPEDLREDLPEDLARVGWHCITGFIR